MFKGWTCDWIKMLPWMGKTDLQVQCWSWRLYHLEQTTKKPSCHAAPTPCLIPILQKKLSNAWNKKRRNQVMLQRVTKARLEFLNGKNSITCSDLNYHAQALRPVACIRFRFIQSFKKQDDQVEVSSSYIITTPWFFIIILDILKYKCIYIYICIFVFRCVNLISRTIALLIPL